jgi:hypothetical protein
MVEWFKRASDDDRKPPSAKPLRKEDMHQRNSPRSNSVFKPASQHEKSVNAMFDQVVAWGGALKALRE